MIISFHCYQQSVSFPASLFLLMLWVTGSLIPIPLLALFACCLLNERPNPVTVSRDIFLPLRRHYTHTSVRPMHVVRVLSIHLFAPIRTTQPEAASHTSREPCYHVACWIYNRPLQSSCGFACECRFSGGGVEGRWRCGGVSVPNRQRFNSELKERKERG